MNQGRSARRAAPSGKTNEAKNQWTTLYAAYEMALKKIKKSGSGAG
jgi:hypothetical protein